MDDPAQPQPPESRASADPVASTQPGSLHATPRRRWRRMLRMATVDTTPLRRHRDFRLLFAGQGISFAGSMITYVAIPYQVYRLTRSSLAVGLLGIAELAPLLVMALLGGALADAHDRRRLLLLAELSLAVMSGVLVLNASLSHQQLWLLYAVSAAMAALDGVQRPALDAMLPRLVDRDELPAANALSSLRMTIGMVGGPAVAGLLLAGIGLAGTYAVDVASFAVSLAALSLMRAVPPPSDAERPSIRRIAEGLRYARSRPELMGTYIADIIAMLFGMPTALLPAIAARYGGPGVLGLLYAAPSVGSLVATATSGWTGHVHRHGLAVLWAAGAWGLAIAAFGLAQPLWLAAGFLGLAGAADMLSGIFRSTIWNQTIPDALRGRLAGIELLSYSTGPLLGNVEAGAVAGAFGVQVSVVSGGVLCVVGIAVTAVLLPAFRAYDGRVAPAARQGAVAQLP